MININIGPCMRVTFNREMVKVAIAFHNNIRLTIWLCGLGLTVTCTVFESAYLWSVASRLSDVSCRHGNTQYIPNPSFIPTRHEFTLPVAAWASIQPWTRSSPFSTLSLPWSCSSLTSSLTTHIPKAISAIVNLKWIQHPTCEREDAHHNT